MSQRRCFSGCSGLGANGYTQARPVPLLRGALFGQLVGQTHERSQVELLGAQAAIDAGGFDLFIAEQGLERVAACLI